MSFLSIRNVRLQFAGVTALDGVTLNLDKGDLFAVIGPNGAGKTSLFNCISGVYTPTSGSIELAGRDITRLAPHDIAGLGVARMFQNLALFENLTVLDNLLVGRHHLYRRPFWSDMLWLPKSRREEVAHRKRVEEIIDFLHLERYRQIPVMILPYGVRKRVELGRALCMEPQLLLLDEPTAGLNQEETEDMARYLLDIKEELHVTQILIEHELRFVMDLADRVAVLDFGKKIADGDPEEVRQDPAVVEAYIGGTSTTPAVMEAAEADADSEDEAHPPPSTEVLQSTLPGWLSFHARTRPNKIALRDKQFGVWQEISWRGYFENVRATARMLWELGVRAGDNVAILSENRPEWLYADLGAQSIGARAIGIYQTNPPADVAYILNDSQAKVLFCEDQEQVDKAVEIAGDTPSVSRVVVFDPRGTRHISDARLMTWEDFHTRGFELVGGKDGWYNGKLAELDPSQPSMVVYTSGTTGNPKGAMLSSKNVIEVACHFNDMMSVGEKDSVLSYLPLCHVAEKVVSVFQPLTAASVVHFGESIATVQTDLREVSPTVFLGVPRIWEKMNASVSVKMKDASWLKRTLYGYFTGKGKEIGKKRRDGAVGAWDRVVWRVGDALVFRPLQERLGLRRCRIPVTGAAPISPDLIEWFHGIGVTVLEGYGQTEVAGVSHANMPGANRIGTVGKPLPLIECRTDDAGEILLRGPSVFCGYLNNPEATAKTIDEDGWLRTGDIGTIDEDGFLRITGRAKEIIITSGGKNLSPEKIENALKTSPYVKEAVAIGDKRKFISALIQIELDNVGDWATRQKIPYTSFEDLTKKEQVQKLIRDEVDKANEHLARVEQVREFRLLPKELSQDDGELTATQKVRRRAVHAAFEELIESIYGRAA